MQDHELTAWLGDIEPTTEQCEQLARADAMVEARYPIPADGIAADVAQDREQALTAAVQVILGDSTPDELVGEWAAAMGRADAAHAALTGAIIAASAATSERALAAQLGLARDTIRKALGK